MSVSKSTYIPAANGNTIVHTHAEEMEAGKTGVAFSGSGTVKLRLNEFGALQ